MYLLRRPWPGFAFAVTLAAILTTTEPAHAQRLTFKDRSEAADPVVSTRELELLLPQIDSARERYLASRDDADLNVLRRLRAEARYYASMLEKSGGVEALGAPVSERIQFLLNRRPAREAGRSLSAETGELAVSKLAAFGSSGSSVFLDVFAEAPYVGFPSAIAFDSQGRMYVASYASDEIFRFEADGRFERIFASGNGLSGPEAIAFDSQDRMYVSSFDNDSVLRWNADGTFDRVVVSAVDGLSGPVGLAIDDSDALYVASYFASEILRWDGAVVSLFSDDESIFEPLGLAFDGSGRLHVLSDDNDHIVRLSVDGTSAQVFVDGPDLTFAEEIAFDSQGRLHTAIFDFVDGAQVLRFDSSGDVEAVVVGSASAFFAGIAIDDDDDIFLPDLAADEVLRFDGVDLETFVPPGLDEPDGIVFGPDGKLYISSYANSSILRWNADGTFDKVFICDCILFGPTGLAFDGAGNLYVSSFDSDEVLRYFPDGTFDDVILEAPDVLGPTGLTFDDSGNLYVSSFFTDEVIQYNPSTMAFAVFANGLSLDGPEGLVFDSDGNLYVAGFFTNEIRKYDSDGTDLGVFADGNGLDGPVGVLFDEDGDLLVSSTGTHQVLRWTSAGAFDEVVADDGGLDGPRGLAIDGQDRLYVSSDGSDQVLRYSLNLAPTTSGIGDVAVDEDDPDLDIDLAPAFADTEDPDDDLVFTVTSNTNPGLVAASISGSTLTLSFASNGFGTADLTVRATDLGGLFVESTFTVDVASVNDIPTITPLADLTILEDETSAPQAFSYADVESGTDDLNILLDSDNDALVPEGFPGFIIEGVRPNLTVAIAPAADANGVANLFIRIDDGTDFVDEPFTVTVVAVNDAPAFTGGADVTVAEDAGAQTIAAWATGVVAGPADEAGQTLTFTVTNDNNALFAVQPSIAANGTLSFTAADDATGSATVSVVLQDDGGTANGGVNESPAQTFTITVNPANDAPTISVLTDVTIREDGATGEIGFTIADVETSSEALTVSGTSSNQAVVPDGSIVFGGDGANRSVAIVPAANAFGTAIITVGVSDGLAVTEETFTLTVTPVNDAPTFTPGANVTVGEDAGSHVVSDWATDLSPGPPNEAGQTLRFDVSNDNVALFKGQPAISSTGSLSFEPAPDATGTANVTVILQDDGGTADGGVDASSPRTFRIDVVAANDAPVISAVNDVTIDEDTSTGPIPFTVADPDNDAADLIVTASSGDVSLLPESGILLGGAGSDRTVSLTPAVNAYGTVSVTLTVSDGIESTATSFVVTISPVNDAPEIDVSGTYTLDELTEDDRDSHGTLISDLLAGAVEDVDEESSAGIALIEASTQNGTWQYSLDGGLTWIGIGDPSASSALLLPPDARIRFRPEADFFGVIDSALKFKAWDLTAGAPGGTADTGGGGGVSPFSAGSVTAGIVILPQSETPDLTLALAVEEHERGPGGTVVFLLAYGVSGEDGAPGVVIVAPRPEGMRFVADESSDGWHTDDDTTYVMRLGHLENGAEGTLRLVLAAETSGSFFFESSMLYDGSAGPDPTPADNVVEHRFSVGASDLSIHLEAIPEHASPGEKLIVDLTVTNDGADTATGTIVELAYPGGVRLGDVTGPARRTWLPGDIGAGNSLSTSFEFDLLEGADGPLTMTAEILRSDQIDRSVDDRRTSLEIAPASQLPGPPDLSGPDTYPADGTEDVGLDVTLMWPALSGADRYHLIVSTSAGKQGIAIDVDTLTVPLFDLHGLSPSTTHYWRVAGINAAGEGPFSQTITFVTRRSSVDSEAPERLPATFTLGSNYPNPFNPSTVIPFDLPEASPVRLRMFDLVGREIAVLIDSNLAPGRHTVTWEAGDRPSGIYVYRLEAGRSFTATRMLVLLR